MFWIGMSATSRLKKSMIQLLCKFIGIPLKIIPSHVKSFSSYLIRCASWRGFAFKMLKKTFKSYVPLSPFLTGITGTLWIIKLISSLSWCLCFRCVIANTHSSLTWGRTHLHWGQQRIGTGCTGRPWSLHLRRHSKPTCMGSCVTSSRWPCRGTGVGLGDFQGSLPAQTVLWFWDSLFSFTLANFSLYHSLFVYYGVSPS